MRVAHVITRLIVGGAQENTASTVLGLHEKPIYLLNIKDYWAPLAGLIEHVIAEGFADKSLLDFISVVDSVADLETQLTTALA